MKKLIALPLSLLLAVTLVACTSTPTERPQGNRVTPTTVDRGTTGYDNCAVPNGNDPCWDATARRFRFEPGAQIVIGVDNENMAAALIAKWNQDYPELAGRVVFRRYESINKDDAGMQGIQLAQGAAPDVVLVIAGEILGKEVNLLPLHPYFQDLTATDTLDSINQTVNRRGTIALSSFADGMVFGWNESMLRALGVDVDTDTNGDGLPDAFDTWEKIFALDLIGRTYKGNTIRELYPIAINDTWSAYSALSVGGFEIFKDGPLNPGFDTPEFLEGLRFIQTFSQQGINEDATGAKLPGSAMSWRWPAFYESDAYPFSLIGTWVNVEQETAATGSTLRFSAMPTFQGRNLRPFSGAKAFGINAFTSYPSAAHEVLRWLYTPSTMSTMVNNSEYLPALQQGAFSTPAIFDPAKNQVANGLRFNQVVPGATLTNNPSRPAMDLYYVMGIQEYFVQVWDGTLTPEQAQAAIVADAAAWLSENNR
jgi:arabinogalactan oligomer / maltooligosaccharide transport system substrate-binding protein